MRCSDCNKFVSFDDTNEPEADDADVDAEGHVSGTVRVYLTCAECGTELKEASFDLNVDMTEEVAAHVKTMAEAKGDKLADVVTKAEADGADAEQAKADFEDAHEACELECEVEAEQTSRTEGKGRSMKTFYGYHATVHLKCSCGHEFGDAEHTDDMQASHMDELT
jgi:hypothetical protein